MLCWRFSTHAIIMLIFRS